MYVARAWQETENSFRWGLCQNAARGNGAIYPCENPLETRGNKATSK